MAELQFEALDLNDINTEAERVNAEPGKDNILDKFVKMPEGEGYLTLRFLPRAKGQPLYLATRTHRLGKYPNLRSFHCPRVLTKTNRGQFWVKPTDRADCPICGYYHAKWQESLLLPKDSPEQKAMQAKLRLLKPIDRFYYNVIVREVYNKKTQKIETNVGPLIYSCGKTVHGKILTAIVGNPKLKKKPYGDITDLTKGRDFVLRKGIAKGQDGMEYPNYDESSFEDVGPAGTQDEIVQWAANMNDLQCLRILKEDDVLRNALRRHNSGLPLTDQEEFDISDLEGVDSDMAAEMGGTRTTVAVNAQPGKPLVKQEKKAEAPKPADGDEVISEAEAHLMADPEFMSEIDGIE